MNYLCIDFGGTKTLVSIISDPGTIVTEIRFETPEQYPDFIEQLAHEINQLPETFTTGVMAVPGLVNHEDGSVVALGNRPWTNFQLQADLLAKTGVTFTLKNDARLAGLAEAVYLKDSYSRVLYITISTGIGAALAVDGQLVPELDDMEVGKMPLEFDGELKPWESVASGKAIVAKYGRRASDITEPEIWQDIAKLFVRGIAPLCGDYQPDVIVFGGGVGQQAVKFSDYVAAELQTILHPVVRQPEALLACHYNDESVIYGCYELGKQLTLSPTA